MEISALLKAVIEQQETRKSGEMPRLRVGQELIGKVVRLEADGRLLIDLGSFRALARSNIEVQPGQVMRLQVVKAGVPLHLQAVEQPPSQGSAGMSSGAMPQLAFNKVLAPSDQQRLTTLMNRLFDAQVGRDPAKSLPLQVQQAMARINTLFDPLPLNRSIGQIAQYLKTVVEDGGLFFEKKLADAVLSGMASKTQAGEESQLPKAPPAAPQTGTVSAGPPPGRGQAAVGSSDLQGQTRQGAAIPEGPQSQAKEAFVPTGPQDKAQPEFVPSGPQGRSQAAFIPADPQRPSPAAAVHGGVDTQSRAESEPAGTQAGTKTDIQPDIHVRTMVGRDVKGQLMILRDFLSASPEPKALADVLTEKETAFLRDAVQRLLTHVEGQQERAAQRSGESDVFQVVTHWIPVESQPSPVQLKVYYPRKKHGGEGRHQKVALLLDLDRLGMLRVDLAMIERTLRIDFYVKSEDVRQAIAAETDEVAGSLKGMFEQVFITTHLSEEKIDQFDREDTNTAAVGRIDIQV